MSRVMPRRFLGILSVVSVTVVVSARPGQDASTVLSAMRAALGGDAALDAIQTFSVGGTIHQTSGNYRRSLSIEVLAILPDHFMTIRRDLQSTGPMPLDITYYDGFRGNELIRYMDANIPLPPDPGPDTPDAIARRRAASLVRQQRTFARLVLLLLGKPVASYPLQFSYVGRETADDVPTDVVEARSTDGYSVRLHVNAQTNLPAFVSWQEAAPVFSSTMTMSRIVTRGGQVVSQTPPVAGAPLPDPASVTTPIVTWKVLPTEFRVQNGLNWPRRIQVRFDRHDTEDMRFGSYRINPRIDPRRFIVGR